MFCPKCGKEINEGSKFCAGCGEKLADSETVSSEDNNQEEVPGRKPLVIIIVILAVGIVILLAVIVVLMINKTANIGNKSNKEKRIEDVAVEVETASLDTGEFTEEILIGETQIEENTGDKVVEPLDEESDTPLFLVTVPAETMSLRRSPGLGDDVIAELPANTFLEWNGETIEESDRKFYKVTVIESQQEGYVSANFCIVVDFQYNENDLSVVAIDNAMYTFEQMVSDIKTLCSSYSDRLSYNVLGTSLDGRDIYEVVLGNPDAENHIMVQASIHGREYINTQLIMRMIEYYAYYYNTGNYQGTAYNELFSKTAIHIVPMANPDGVTISQFGIEALNNAYFGDVIYECYERDKAFLAYREDTLGNMTWMDFYKNEAYDRQAEGDLREITFDEYTAIWKANAAGIDLNKNFDAGWEGIEQKESPAYGNYKGPYAVSEPETQVLVDLAQKREYQCYISYHSKGQLIYYDVNGNKPETTILSENFAVLLENFIKYQKVNTQKGYNVDLGGFSDWIQLDLNKASVTIESGKHPCPLNISEFMPIWLRHRESWAMLANTLY